MLICRFVVFLILSVLFLIPGLGFLGIGIWSKYDNFAVDKLGLPPLNRVIQSILKEFVEGVNKGSISDKKVMDVIQYSFKCCGSSGPSDYFFQNFEGMASCLPPENRQTLFSVLKNLLFQVGCGDALAQAIANQYVFIIIFAVVLTMIGILFLGLSLSSFCPRRNNNNIYIRAETDEKP